MYAALLNNKLVLARQEAELVFRNKKRLNCEKYKCPSCRKRVILIVSESKMAFFKHVTTYRFGQGEKEEHHQSKLLLKSAFTAAGFDAKNEISLADGGLRADVLVSNKLALEVQCAPLSQEEFDHRHHLYKNIGILDLWIVGKRHYLKQRLKETQLMYFRENKNWGKYYLEISPVNQILTLKYNVLQEPVTKNLHYQTMKFKLDEEGIKQFWQFHGRKIKYYLDTDKQKRYLKTQIRQKSKLGMSVAELLYMNKMTLEDIPEKVFSEWRRPGELDAVSNFLQNKKPSLR